jgi:hypothetical protein
VDVLKVKIQKICIWPEKGRAVGSLFMMGITENISSRTAKMCRSTIMHFLI